MWRSSEALLSVAVCGVLLVFDLTWHRLFPSGAGKIATLLHYLGKVVIVNRHLFSCLQLEWCFIDRIGLCWCAVIWGARYIEFGCLFTTSMPGVNINTVFA